MNRPLQAVVFDFDGVIANSEPLHLRAFQEALAADCITLTAQEYYSRYLGYDDVGMVQALARDRKLPASSRYVTEMVALKGIKMQQMLHGGEVLFPGADRFIREAARAVTSLDRPIGESGDAVVGRRWWQRSWQPVRSPALGELGVEEAHEFAVACDELVERSGFDD